MLFVSFNNKNKYLKFGCKKHTQKNIKPKHKLIVDNFDILIVLLKVSNLMTYIIFITKSLLKLNKY